MPKQARTASQTAAPTTVVTPVEQLTMPQQKEKLGFLVGTYYAIQSHRIKANNRLSAIQRRKIVPLSEVNALHQGIEKKILAIEQELVAEVRPLVKYFDIWRAWLSTVKGIGEILAGNLIAYLDPAKFDTPSKLWRYCGLAAIKGESERYVPGEKAHFAKKYRTLCWKIGESFVKNGQGYQELYRHARRKLSIFGSYLTTDPIQTIVCQSYSQGLLQKGTCAYIIAKGLLTKKELTAVRARVKALTKTPPTNKNGKGATTDQILEQAQHEIALAHYKAFYSVKALLIKPCAKGTNHYRYVIDKDTGKRTSVKDGECGDAHRHAKALRWMVKVFLFHYWKTCRELEGLPIKTPYSHQYLDGHLTEIPRIQDKTPNGTPTTGPTNDSNNSAHEDLLDDETVIDTVEEDDVED